MTPLPPDATPQTVAIIGGGPAGLATARALKIAGIPYTLFERHSDFGGIWDLDNPGTPMYRSAHFISSKTTSGHEGFAMPASYPDYPSNRQILDFVRSFARAFNLYEGALFNTSVSHIEDTGSGWQVTYGHQGETRTEPFGWVVCATGTNWFPNRPALKGEDSFTGTIMHANGYRDPEMLKGKRVVVVGAGNSGVDIACDAAFMADAAYTSMRRGYHFLPKHIFGQPADVFAQSSNWIPLWLEQRIFGAMLRVLNGDLTRLGLQKPDHRVFESHPILNTQILHYLQHGDLIAKPDIAELSGDEVVFTDNTRARVDLIILATGYDWHLPYLPPDLFPWKDNRAQAYLKLFNPKHPTLFLNGFIETNSSAYRLFDEMAMLIAQVIKTQAGDAKQARIIEAVLNGPEPDLGGSVHYVNSPRHTGYTNVDAFKAAMTDFRKRFGWPAPADYYAALPPRPEAENAA